LSQGYIKHGYECLLDSWWTFQESLRELFAGKGLEDGWEKSSVQLANVRDRNGSGGFEDFVLRCMVDVQEKGRYL
jgi:hypothetical protein